MNGTPSVEQFDMQGAFSDKVFSSHTSTTFLSITLLRLLALTNQRGYGLDENIIVISAADTLQAAYIARAVVVAPSSILTPRLFGPAIQPTRVPIYIFRPAYYNDNIIIVL